MYYIDSDRATLIARLLTQSNYLILTAVDPESSSVSFMMTTCCPPLTCHAMIYCRSSRRGCTVGVWPGGQGDRSNDDTQVMITLRVGLRCCKTEVAHVYTASTSEHAQQV